MTNRKRIITILLLFTIISSCLFGCNPEPDDPVAVITPSSGETASADPSGATAGPETAIPAGTETAVPTYTPDPAGTATSVPTSVPTLVPTDVPTDVPTPTQKPTATPTSVPTPTQAPTPTPVPSHSGNPIFFDPDSLPYAKYHIEVSLKAQIVYIYALNSDGSKGDLVHAMICSTGIDGKTPARKWVILDNETDKSAVKDRGGFISKYKFEWLTNDDCGQYLTRMWKVDEVDGNEKLLKSSFLFHSVPYSSKNKDALRWEEWNKLGTPASHGCVRLCVRDAKWIYDHVAPWSYVYTIEGTEDPELWAALKMDDIPAGTKHDPTDIY